MTNLFYVHSNITYIAAISLIQTQDIRNVTILFGRDYKNESITFSTKKIFLSAQIQKLTNIPTYGERWLVFKHFKAIGDLDVILNSSECDGFRCYLPNTNNFLMQAIITHKQCKEYNLLEEGLLSHHQFNHIVKETNQKFNSSLSGKIRRTFKYINHKNRSVYYRACRAKFGKLYLLKINVRDLHSFDNRYEILNWPDLNLCLPDLSNSKIFVFDNTVGDNITDQLSNLKILSAIFLRLKGERLYVKFHPAQHDTDTILKQLGSMQISYQILDIDLPMELIFLRSEGLQVFGLFSSLLFYAKAAGHQSYSFLNVAVNIDPGISLWIKNNLPDEFFHSVCLL